MAGTAPRQNRTVTSYRRPHIDAPVFRDADGQPIPYGERWAHGPPDDTYSVVNHPERFRPLHTVADALIAHLGAVTDATVTEDPAVAAELRHPPTVPVRAVRVTPARSDAAPLIFAFTPHPGIILHAGALQEFVFPSCGCDACDEEWVSQAENLEWIVLAVAAGRFAESISRGWRATHTMRVFSPDGDAQGSSEPLRSLGREKRAEARARLAAAPRGWQPWPLA